MGFLEQRNKLTKKKEELNLFTFDFLILRDTTDDAMDNDKYQKSNLQVVCEKWWPCYRCYMDGRPFDMSNIHMSRISSYNRFASL